MVSTMNRLIAEALFVSEVQPSEQCSCEVVQDAVTRTILRYGSDGCAAAMAAEFGEHPETAVRRMCWVHETLIRVYPTFAGNPTTPGVRQPTG
jgi:hypothetical protein